MNEHFPTGAIQSWKRRVEAHHAQSLRVMDETRRTGDFWKPVAAGFRADPRRTDDEALNAISELAPDGSTLLDVGGGAGRFAVALAFNSPAVTVVDPSEAMLDQLREATSEAGLDNVSAVRAEWQDAQVEAADVALCSHVVYGVAGIEPFENGHSGGHGGSLGLRIAFAAASEQPQDSAKAGGHQRLRAPPAGDLRFCNRFQATPRNVNVAIYCGGARGR